MSKLQPFLDEVDDLTKKFERFVGKPASETEKNSIFINVLRHKLGLDPLKGKPILSGQARHTGRKVGRYREVKKRNFKNRG